MSSTLLDKIDIRFYRCDQYKNAAEAKSAGALRFVSSVYGYTAAVDVLEALAVMSDAWCHESAKSDVKVLLCIDDEHDLQECYLCEAHTRLTGWLNS